MGYPKGKNRPEGAGRRKGTPNKKTQVLSEICEQEGIDPFRALLNMAAKNSDDQIRLGALKEICQYLYPKRKALEHSGAIENPYMSKTFEELKAEVKAVLGES